MKLTPDVFPIDPRLFAAQFLPVKALAQIATTLCLKIEAESGALELFLGDKTRLKTKSVVRLSPLANA